LSKILGDKPKYWGKMVVITAESIGVSQLLRALARVTHKVYAYAS